MVGKTLGPMHCRGLRLALGLCGCVATLVTIACAEQTRVDAGIAFVDVAVVDVIGASVSPGMTVTVLGERITHVVPSADLELGPDVQTVDGSGRFLIPGLWDMHVHFTGTARHVRQVELPVYIANGVTGVRLMSGDCDAAYIRPSSFFSSCMTETSFGHPPAEMVATWRHEILAGSQIGPEIIASSIHFDGTGPCGAKYSVGTADEARDKVRDAQSRGADFLKIYNCSLEADAYYAVAEEARRLGIDFAGHVPSEVTLSQAAAAGQKSIEHVGLELLEECSTAPIEVARARRRRQDSPAAREAHNELLLRTFDVAACEPLIETLLLHGTALVPTLSVFRGLKDDQRFETDERFRYLAPSVRDHWRQAVDQRIVVDPTVREERRRPFLPLFEAVTAMDGRGVVILAGSDAAGPLIYPGFSLHEELELLVEAGLTHLAALRASTLNPARFLGRADDLGTVEEGKRADLVLLAADPLEDIANTQSIEAVMAAGQLFDREALDRILASAAPAASGQ